MYENELLKAFFLKLYVVGSQFFSMNLDHRLQESFLIHEFGEKQFVKIELNTCMNEIISLSLSRCKARAEKDTISRRVYSSLPYTGLVQCWDLFPLHGLSPRYPTKISLFLRIHYFFFTYFATICHLI